MAHEGGQWVGLVRAMMESGQAQNVLYRLAREQKIRTRYFTPMSGYVARLQFYVPDLRAIRKNGGTRAAAQA